MFDTALLESRTDRKGRGKGAGLPLAIGLHIAVIGAFVGASVWSVGEPPEPVIPVTFFAPPAAPPPPRGRRRASARYDARSAVIRRPRRRPSRCRLGPQPAVDATPRAEEPDYPGARRRAARRAIGTESTTEPATTPSVGTGTESAEGPHVGRRRRPGAASCSRSSSPTTPRPPAARTRTASSSSKR